MRGPWESGSPCASGVNLAGVYTCLKLCAIRCKGSLGPTLAWDDFPNGERSIKEELWIHNRRLGGHARWMNGRMDGQINEWRPGIKRGDWEGFPWVGTGKQPCDGKLSNSFHRLPEDWSFTRARWAGATGAAWRSWTKPRHRDRAGPYHHSAHELLPPPTPAPDIHQHQLCLCTQTHYSRNHQCLVSSESYFSYVQLCPFYVTLWKAKTEQLFYHSGTASKA